MLVRPLMTNFKMLISSDCAFSGCSPLPQPIKALICLWTESPIPSYLLASKIKQTFLSSSLTSSLALLASSWTPLWVIEGNGIPLQYSCLENTMGGGDWWSAVHGVAKSQTRLSDFTFTFHFHALEKEMATHSSVLAWRIPGTGEPGGLPSLGSHRVGHN